MAALSRKSHQSQSGVSAICAAVAIQQQNLSLLSQDRFVHPLQFTGSLTAKVQQCNIMAVCSCSAGAMSHFRKAIIGTCSFAKAEMFKPVNTDLSRYTLLTGHHSCRSCRQYIKPTLTVQLSCRSSRQYIKPTLTGDPRSRTSRQYIKPNLAGHLSCRSCR
jgi:hypothetical protein